MFKKVKMRFFLIFCLTLAVANVTCFKTSCKCVLWSKCPRQVSNQNLTVVQPRSFLCPKGMVCCKSAVNEDDYKKTEYDDLSLSQLSSQVPIKYTKQPYKSQKIPTVKYKSNFYEEEENLDKIALKLFKLNKSYIKEELKNSNNVSKDLKCGVRRKSEIIRRVASDAQNSFAEKHELPWQAAIMKEENGAYMFQCSGAIVDQQKIVTSAHNVKNLQANSMVVRVGEHDFSTISESMLPHQDLSVSKVILHPDYNDELLHNDIAVVCVNKLRYSGNVSPICLPRNSFQSFEHCHCLVSGWGKQKLDGNYSTILKRVSLNVIDRNYCENLLGNRLETNNYKLHSSFLCAGGKQNQDSCQGDGGGPLACRDLDGNFYLAGVVSWGIGCGEKEVPGVYTNVSEMLKWIDNVSCKDDLSKQDIYNNGSY